MMLVQMDFHEAPILKDEMAWDGQDILNETSWPKTDERCARGKHPTGCPGQEIVRQIGEQNESFLSTQVMFAPFFHLETRLVSLDFGLAATPVIVVFKDLVVGPLCHRRHKRPIFRLT